MKSVIIDSYKATGIVGAGYGSGARAETFWKSKPEPKQKVSAPQHWFEAVLWIHVSKKPKS